MPGIPHEMEAGGMQAQGLPGLNSEFEASLAHWRLCIQIKIIKRAKDVAKW